MGGEIFGSKRKIRTYEKSTFPAGIVGNYDKTGATRSAGAGRGHALGRRLLHGEVTLHTKDGVKTIVMARGSVTALSDDAIKVKSSDGIETSFAINDDTRFGFRNEPDPTAELKVGEDAFVAGEKSGDRAVTRRVVSGDLAGKAAKDAAKGATP